jgi:DNA polymerase-3 subunit epsilon
MICCLTVADVQAGTDHDVCTPRTRVTNIAKYRYDVYIGRGRGSVWGNPFHEGQHGTKSEVIERYRVWIQTQPQLMARLPELRGKILGCWCYPDICHGDVLAELADRVGVSTLDADAGEVYIAPAAAECQPAVLPPKPVNLDDYDTTVIILDVETTGVDTLKDQVIELAIQFGFGDGDRPGPCEVMRFKPTIPIPAEVTAIHGIRDEDVAGLSSFGAAAAYVEQVIEAATVIVGYNVEFDLKMLDAELRRVKRRLDLRGKVIVDPMQLWRVCEPRTLQGAHQRFAGGPFENAHSAGADVAATGRVLLGMLDHFGHTGKFWDEIATVASPDRLTWLGFTNHFIWKDGRVLLNFGKHAGTDVRASIVKGYLTWMQKQDFPAHVIEIAKAAGGATPDAAFLQCAAPADPPPTPAVLP